MLRENKWKIIISSLVILLPVVFGCVVWNRLPETMATHWGVNGEADSFSGRAASVFVPSFVILLIHWACIFFSAKDPKNRGQNRKVFGLVIWITPVVSLAVNGMMYASAFGWEMNPGFAAALLLGVMFVLIGNYMPKCSRNSTIGIKVRWTLMNDENWNVTHRFAGKVWVAGGVILMLCAFLPEKAVMYAVFASILVMVPVPVVYSYLYYRKQLRMGNADSSDRIVICANKKAAAAGGFITAAVLALVLVVMFTGNISVGFGDDEFTVHASYWKDLTVEYDSIENVEYRENDDRGSRTNGFGSPRLLMGTFKNDEFGYYTRYSYTKCISCVVLRSGEKTLVLSGRDDADTLRIYETIKDRISDNLFQKEGG